MFIISKNQLLISLIFPFVLLVSISFISALIFGISFLPLTLGVFSYSFWTIFPATFFVVVVVKLKENRSSGSECNSKKKKYYPGASLLTWLGKYKMTAASKMPNKIMKFIRNSWGIGSHKFSLFILSLLNDSSSHLILFFFFFKDFYCGISNLYKSR